MTWIVMVAVGVGSYLFRLGPLLVLQRVSLSDRADQLIRHAGTAANHILQANEPAFATFIDEVERFVSS